MGAALLLFGLGFGILAAGILIGRYYVPDDRQLKRTARNARSYMRAVNFLLARDKDAAVDELRAVVAEDVKDIEPYFALGALFRSRGEWERAVRVHQAIELRPDSDRHVRLRAIYELGLDFRTAGMPRRATRAMEQCLEEDGKHEGALRALCGLYEEQGRFGSAAEAWARLEKLRGGDRSPRELHLWAAAATRAVESGNLDEARRCLKRAARLGSDDPHVLAASAEVSAARGNPKAASKQLRQALIFAPDLAAYFAPALAESERLQLLAQDSNREQALAELTDEQRDDIERLVVDRTARALDEVIAEVGPKPTLVYARATLRSHRDIEGALADLRLVSDKEPSLLSARVAAARLVLALGDSAEAQAELASLIAPGGPLAERSESSWVCGDCGRIATLFFWRCESCRQWGTVWFDWHKTRVDPKSRRERRVANRPRMLAGAGAAPGAPEMVDETGDSSEQRGPSVIGRAGAWISGAWSGMRGKGSHREGRPDDDGRLGD